MAHIRKLTPDEGRPLLRPGRQYPDLAPYRQVFNAVTAGDVLAVRPARGEATAAMKRRYEAAARGLGITVTWLHKQDDVYPIVVVAGPDVTEGAPEGID